MAAAAVVGGDDDDGSDRGRRLDPRLRPRRPDRRWVFLLATTTIVAVTGLWPESQAAIFVLLALAGLFVLVVHDLLPATALGAAKFVRRGLRRDHRRDAARRADRWRRRARSSSSSR